MADEQAKQRRFVPAIAEELLAPLGRVTATFASLESQVASSVGIFLSGNRMELQRVGQIVTADLSFKKGKCGRCEFRAGLAGSRARAYAINRDPLAEDPSCVYRPLGH